MSKEFLRSYVQKFHAKEDKEKIPKRNRYKGHHFSLGIRFDL